MNPIDGYYWQPGRRFFFTSGKPFCSQAERSQCRARFSRLRHAAGKRRRGSGVCKHIAEVGRISFNTGGASEREKQEACGERTRSGKWHIVVCTWGRAVPGTGPGEEADEAGGFSPLPLSAMHTRARCPIRRTFDEKPTRAAAAGLAVRPQPSPRRLPKGWVSAFAQNAGTCSVPGTALQAARWTAMVNMLHQRRVVPPKPDEWMLELLGFFTPKASLLSRNRNESRFDGRSSRGIWPGKKTCKTANALSPGLRKHFMAKFGWKGIIFRGE